MEGNVIIGQISINLCDEIMCSNEDSQIEFFTEDGKSTVILINRFNLEEYYNKFYASLEETTSNINDDEILLPLYIDVKSKKLMGLSYIDEMVKNNELKELDIYNISLDFGEGSVDYIIIDITKSIIEKAIINNSGLTANLDNGTVYFPVDLLSLIFNTKEIVESKSVAFMFDEEISFKGILLEANLESGQKVRIIPFN